MTSWACIFFVNVGFFEKCLTFADSEIVVPCIHHRTFILQTLDAKAPSTASEEAYTVGSLPGEIIPTPRHISLLIHVIEHLLIEYSYTRTGAIYISHTYKMYVCMIEMGLRLRF